MYVMYQHIFPEELWSKRYSNLEEGKDGCMRLRPHKKAVVKDC